MHHILVISLPYAQNLMYVFKYVDGKISDNDKELHYIDVSPDNWVLSDDQASFPNAAIMLIVS